MIEGLDVDVRPDVVWVRSRARLRTLGSSVVGGGSSATHHILNMHVSRGYHGRLPAADLRAFAGTLGIGEPFVGLMTAAWTHEAAVVTEADAGVVVTVVATVGLGSPIAAGLSGAVASTASTINVIAVLEARIERATAVNGVITATEAKVGALAEAGILTGEGWPATGTVTDAVVIAWTGRGESIPYLGPGSPAGSLLARAVRRAVREGLGRA